MIPFDFKIADEILDAYAEPGAVIDKDALFIITKKYQQKVLELESKFNEAKDFEKRLSETSDAFNFLNKRYRDLMEEAVFAVKKLGLIQKKNSDITGDLKSVCEALNGTLEMLDYMGASVEKLKTRGDWPLDK